VTVKELIAVLSTFDPDAIVYNGETDELAEIHSANQDIYWADGKKSVIID
jgi:hypothetical protein